MQPNGSSRMKGRLADRVAIVIGAAQGIGAAIAQRFVEEGARVAIGDVNEAAGRLAADRLRRDGVLSRRTDVSSERDMAALADATAERFGRIDILVQNAGIYPVSLIESTTQERWDRILGVNLTGAFLAARACIPAMR